MQNYQVTQIRDLKRALKDLEPYVKDVRFLQVGRDFSNFAQRPRELLANLLICMVGIFNTGRDLTVAEDPRGGDGIILDRGSDERVDIEHVFIPDLPQNVRKSVDDLFVEAIEGKITKGAHYATGKNLVIFSNARGYWHPDKIARLIDGRHSFNWVWGLFLEGVGIDQSGYYNYAILSLTRRDKFPNVYRVVINPDFSGWNVSVVKP